ncbi:MAG TPA: bifunctional proline dehydrogenase/L-glutamate gamma-semialdehyde dehydrogenase, partial [Tepidiformaceae bacterium]|nr:bifunctional proline dehydrogenase/L-glutamate gamma-semialdehyde dehydrogenase [Tepidiformaceae bacterium]
VRLYFADDPGTVVRLGARTASSRLARPVLSRVVRQAMFHMADRFIAGSASDRVLPTLAKLLLQGTGYTIDVLGEATLSDAEADEQVARYRAMLDTLTGLRIPGAERRFAPNISLKLSAFTPHLEPAAPEKTITVLRARLFPLLRAARAYGAFVNIDMEQHRFKDLAHGFFQSLALDPEFRDWDGIGIVVQAYQRDAGRDIERLAVLAQTRGAALTVRLVKGAYWDEEVAFARQESRTPPVFLSKGATDASFEQSTVLLLSHYPMLRPAVGTHNPRSIANAIAAAESRSMSPEALEFQMLFGMAEGLRKATGALGYPTRVYVPVGEVIPGMAYLVRRLLENTSNESWLLHRHEQASPVQVLAKPDARDPAAAHVDQFERHPPAEFDRPEVRTAMIQAITGVSARYGSEYPLLIDGKEVRTGEQRISRPVEEPGAELGRVTQARADTLEQAVAAARRAYPAWRDAPARVRADALRRASNLIAERRFELAATMVVECAKPWREADGDVCEAIDFLRYYADRAEVLNEGYDLPVLPGETNRYVHEGRGVAAIIAPWNFPLALITGMTAGALAAGCSTVLKPASQSPIIAYHLVRILQEAGVPPGTVNYLPGDGNTIGGSLVVHPDVDMVAFTGSGPVGLAIIEAASSVNSQRSGVRRVIAEMGGKNAIIVDEDADLDEAVAGVITSAFGYAGQKCSACSRVVVVGSAYGEFRDRLAAAVMSLPVGPAADPYTVVPPVISEAARTKIAEYVTLGEREGTLVARGHLPSAPGPYVAPHVFEEVDATSRLARDEIFGPVLTLFRAPTFSAALALALDSEYALTGGLYSRHPQNIERARREFRVGNLYINRKVTGAIVGRQPFGGFKLSGTDDKAGGPDYVRQFTHARVITENTMRRGFSPPPSPGRSL